ncbi:putative transcriptional regulator YheO [Paraburkholderia sp. BL8N3]|jgi:predicted transcriptional regulator YheO|nr:PAS domain-containing protein [Paraburkholderia sp. BL8N3]TCK34889.1 putative transcriptional regulator YheO [Paraburkholderia sp. BL8N3]
MIDIGFLKAAADGIAALLFPDLEAVVHDARTGLVAHIANGFSKRKPGDPSLISDLPALQEGGDVIGPYEKGGPNNRKLRSITIVARSEQGEIVALLCLNFDVSALTQVQKLLSGFAVGAQSQARPDTLFRSDWKERLNEIAEQVSAQCCVRTSDFGRTEITLVLAQARADGLLSVRNFIDHVGEYFGVSRATVYNYLKAAPGEAAATHGDSEPANGAQRVRAKAPSRRKWK